MEDTRELLAGALSALKHGLKLTPTEQERIWRWKADLEQSKRDHYDRLKSRKQSLKQVEIRIQSLAREYDDEVGAVKEIVGGELELACAEREKMTAPARKILANIRATDTVLGKMAEFEEALRSGVSEERADSLAVELEDALDRLERADTAIEELSRLDYSKRSEVQAPDVAQTLREIRGEQHRLPARAEQVLAQIRAVATETE